MGRFGLGPASGSNMRVSISGPVSSFYFKSNCVSGFGFFLVVFLVFPGRYFLQSEAGERQSSGLVSSSTVMRPNLGSASGSSCTISGSNSGSVSGWFFGVSTLVGGGEGPEQGRLWIQLWVKTLGSTSGSASCSTSGLAVAFPSVCLATKMGEG